MLVLYAIKTYVLNKYQRGKLCKKDVCSKNLVSQKKKKCITLTYMFLISMISVDIPIGL